MQHSTGAAPMPDRYGDEPQEMPDEIWAAEQSRVMAIVNCDLCDDDGYRGCVRCDHIDRTDIYRRGMEQVRAALRRTQ